MGLDLWDTFLEKLRLEAIQGVYVSVCFSVCACGWCFFGGGLKFSGVFDIQFEATLNHKMVHFFILEKISKNYLHLLILNNYNIFLAWEDFGR